ncbi:MAG: hypothetical protein GVY31_15060 [Alphaproteobacteria bacterium]|jgi:uncharacterized protein|nr:hypothetical protein [Alphaproteobacteria bacterium]
MATPVAAEPSFPCSGQLTPTESRICDSPLLGALDRRMARAFYAARDRASGAASRDLIEAQRLWLRWRATCGSDGDCLRRRYEARLADLGTPDLLTLELATPGNATAAADQVVDRRITDTRYEVEYGDGTVRWQSIGGGSMGVTYPDGTGTTSMFSQAPPPEFPGLPGSFASWGDGLETSLLGIIDQLLSPADRQEYRTLTDAKPYSVRVSDHLTVIQFLTRP